LKDGAREAAVHLLRAAIARDPGEMACAALLKAVEARPDSSVYGPDIRLDLSLARRYARRGWLIESLCLLEGAGLTAIPGGAELAHEIREILGPIPDDAPRDLRDADEQVRRGGASVALMTFDEWVATGRPLPPWAERRHQLLSTLLLDAAPAARPSSEITTMTPVGAALNTQLASRNLDGALTAAKTYLLTAPNDSDAQAVVVALGRIVEAMAAVSADVNVAAMRTQPMTGVNVALFQTRMCNFDVAERMFRKLVISDPMDARARAYLDDVQTIQRALGAVVTAPPGSGEQVNVDPLRSTAKAQYGAIISPDPTASRRPRLRSAPPVERPRVERPPAQRPPRVAPQPITASPILEEPTRRVGVDELRSAVAASAAAPLPNESTRKVEVKAPGQKKKQITSPNLLKKSGRPAADGWALPEANASDWDEVSTEIGDPDQMAELMLKQGYAERALRIYERLAGVYPDRERYARRAEEIQQLIESGAVPELKTVPGEDYLASPDQADTTMGERDVPVDPRAPAAGSAIDALAPRMSEVPEMVGLADLPPTADHSALRAEVPEPLAWNEEDTTIVGDSSETHDFDDHDDDDDDPTSVGLSREEMNEIVGAVDSRDKPRTDDAVIVRRVIAIH
jgi:hypothetical protein